MKQRVRVQGTGEWGNTVKAHGMLQRKFLYETRLFIQPTYTNKNLSKEACTIVNEVPFS